MHHCHDQFRASSSLRWGNWAFVGTQPFRRIPIEDGEVEEMFWIISEIFNEPRPRLSDFTKKNGIGRCGAVVRRHCHAQFLKSDWVSCGNWALAGSYASKRIAIDNGEVDETFPNNPGNIWRVSPMIKRFFKKRYGAEGIWVAVVRRHRHAQFPTSTSLFENWALFGIQPCSRIHIEKGESWRNVIE